MGTIDKLHDGLFDDRINDIVVKDNWAFIGTAKGLSVINIDNYEVNNWDINSPVNCMLLSGNELFVGTDSGVRRLDITDPEDITESSYYTTTDLYRDKVTNLIELSGELWVSYAFDFAASPVTDKVTKVSSGPIFTHYATKNYGAACETRWLDIYDSKILALDNYCLMQIDPADGSIDQEYFPSLAANAQIHGAPYLDAVNDRFYMVYAHPLNYKLIFVEFNLSTWAEVETYELSDDTIVAESGISYAGLISWGDEHLWGESGIFWGGLITTGMKVLDNALCKFVPNVLRPDGSLWELAIYDSPGNWGVLTIGKNQVQHKYPDLAATTDLDKTNLAASVMPQEITCITDNIYGSASGGVFIKESADKWAAFLESEKTSQLEWELKRIVSQPDDPLDVVDPNDPDAEPVWKAPPVVRDYTLICEDDERDVLELIDDDKPE